LGRSLRYVLPMHEDSDTEELTAAQRKREAEEQELARSADDEHELAQHQRRAQKARYLREKLEERSASEDEAED
jgi:hypothetical protein